MSWFFNRQHIAQDQIQTTSSFSLPNNSYYFDSACQTLRPKEVLSALNEYYTSYNACAGRVKYPWGKRVDNEVADTRRAFLEYYKKSPKEYAIAFTLNTTYGINLILQQLPWEKYTSITTTDIEHNSVFLPSMTHATLQNKKRYVLERTIHGNLNQEQLAKEPTVLIMNCMSNIDGRSPDIHHIQSLEQSVRSHGGILLLDAAQAAGHHPELIQETSADAYFLSGHKMYGPSIGIIIIKHTLLSQMHWSFIGGGSVSDVEKDTFTLLPSSEDPVAPLEPGLQLWGEIIGMKHALHFLKQHRNSTENELSKLLWENLSSLPSLQFTHSTPSSITTFWSERIDAHTLAMILGEQGIMARSGYFCCHYYLKNSKKYPPLLRISLGLHTSKEDIHYLTSTLSSILSAL